MAPASVLDVVLVVAFYFCYYFELSISYDGTVLVPFFGCAVVASVILLANQSRIRSSHVTGLSLIFLLYASSAIVHLGDSEQATRRLSSLMNGCLVLFLGYCWYLALTRLTSTQISRLALCVAAFITAYALLERIELFRSISDEARSFIYSAGVYDEDVRDIALYGAVRPKVFLREPSLVGINLGLALSVWLLSARVVSLRRLLVTLGWLGAAIFAVRSPTLVMFGLLCVYGYVTYSPAWRNLSWPLGVLLLVATFVLPAFVLVLSALFGDVFERIVTGWSFYLREIGPFNLAQIMLTEQPLFGYGIGASQVLLRDVQSTYASLAAISGITTFQQSVAVRPDFFITNAFWQFWIVFGLLSGSLIIAALARLLDSLGTQSRLFVFVTFSLVGQTLGGITGLWVAFILFTYISIDALQKEARLVRMRGQPQAFRNSTRLRR